MEKVLITCPFTGLEFEGVKFADGRIVTTNALTGEEIRIGYNPSIRKYMLDASLLKHIPLVTMEECAEELGISKPRISVLVKQGRLTSIKPSSALYITKESMLEYKQHQRKLAAEKSNNGAGNN